MTITPYLQDADFTLYHGEALAVLRELPAESVHCVVTSPPYFGLRDYGTAGWEGGDPDCEHEGDARFRRGWTERGVCVKCGAVHTDEQLGLEATPYEYVDRLVEVFREVRRVLRHDGTVWLNLGDSYAQDHAQKRSKTDALGRSVNTGIHAKIDGSKAGELRGTPPGLKPKDLIGVPWRVALALQDDGWWLRSDVIWSKPSCMPESVTDRPTRSHEYVFLLTKSARYFYDLEAIREPVKPGNKGVAAVVERQGGTAFDEDGKPKGARREYAEIKGANKRTVWEVEPEPTKRNPTWEERKAAGAWAGNVGVADNYQNNVHGEGLSHDLGDPAQGRNKRTVWEIGIEPFPDAHFAVFPQKLVEPCVLAGTSEKGCCPECGAPWRRVTERGTAKEQRKNWRGEDNAYGVASGNHKGRTGNWGSEIVENGWEPTCECFPGVVDDHFCPENQPVPCTVLDPFMGSGTTALVSRRLGRRSVGIELNRQYADLAAQRLSQLSLFAT